MGVAATDATRTGRCVAGPAGPSHEHAILGLWMSAFRSKRMQGRLGLVDPNVTKQEVLRQPTRSYRTRDPVPIVEENVDWAGHSPTSWMSCDCLTRVQARGR